MAEVETTGTTRGIRNRAQKIYELLESEYGPANKSPAKLLIEHLLIASLSAESSRQNAVRVYNKLRKYFVDWNEVRVSSQAEIGAVLGPQKEALQAAGPVKDLLAKIFAQFHCLSLEFAETLSARRLRTTLLAVGGIERRVIDAALVEFCDDSESFVTTDIVRVSQRLGLVGKDASPVAVHRRLQELAPKERGHGFRILLERHGLAKCLPRSDSCGGCVVENQCVHEA